MMFISSTSNEFNLKTLVRDNKGEIISNDGFSVVAPIKTKVPFSTAFNKESCCVLLNL